MKHYCKNSCFLFISIFILCIFVTSEAICSIPKPQRKESALDNVKGALQAEQKQEKILLKTEKKLETEISSIRRELVDLTKGIKTHKSNLKNKKNKISKLQKQKKEVVASLMLDQKSLGKIISAQHKISQLPEATWLSTENFHHRIQSQSIIRSLLPTLYERSKTLSNKAFELENLEKVIVQEIKSRKRLQASLSKNEKILQSKLRKRKNIYKKTASNRKKHQEYAKRLSYEAQNLEELISSIKRKKTYKTQRSSKRKSFTPPISGDITTSFGEQNNLGIISEGITLSTNNKTPVISPMAGIIRFAGPFKNYKQLLIIEHGNGYHSLIGGDLRIDIETGIKILAGEPIGIINGNNNKKEYLYYELRHNGDPIDPAPKLIADKNNVKGS